VYEEPEFDLLEPLTVFEVGGSGFVGPLAKGCFSNREQQA
jgi:hypothetical protein